MCNKCPEVLNHKQIAPAERKWNGDRVGREVVRERERARRRAEKERRD